MMMMTEGLRSVEDADDQNESNEVGEEEGDYLDEYGNLKESASVKPKPKSVINDDKTKADNKETKKQSKKEKLSKNNKNGGNKFWTDLDNVSPQDNDTMGGSKKQKEYVKSAINVPAISNKLMYPRPSSLTWAEQEKFLYNQKLLREGRLTPANGNQWTFYQNFLELVTEEQEEFAQFTHDNYSPVDTVLCDDHKRYVTEHRTARVQRPLSLPRWWDKIKVTRLLGEGQSCAMLLEQTLLELGKIPQTKFPDLFRNNKSVHSPSLPVNYMRLVHNIPPDPRVEPGTAAIINQRKARREKADQQFVDQNKFLHKVSCIDDPNCGIFAQHLVPDVIISSSALKCLMDNHKSGMNKTWDIPFIVRTFKSEVDTRTVVIFGKPLLSRQVTEEDFSNLAHKISVKVGLFVRDGQVKIVGEEPKPKRTTPVEDLFGDTEVDLDKLEVFGTDSDVHKVTQQQATPANMEIDDEISQLDGADSLSDSDEENLVISDVTDAQSAAKVALAAQKMSISEPAPDLDESLDYEPDEEEDDGNLSDGSSDSDCTDSQAAQALFLENFKMNLTSQNINFTEDSNGLVKIEPSKKTETADNVLQLDQKQENEPKDTDQGGSESESSDSTSDDEGGQLLMQKKLMMMQQQQAAAANSSSNTTNPVDKSGVADNQSNMNDDIDDAPMVTDTVADDEKMVLSDHSDNEMSPKKKIKRISSDSSDNEEVDDKNDTIKKKLVELGKDNVDVGKLKQKMTVTNKLKALAIKNEAKTQVQATSRALRSNRRNQQKDSLSSAKGEESSTNKETVAPRRSTRTRQRSTRLLIGEDSPEMVKIQEPSSLEVSPNTSVGTSTKKNKSKIYQMISESDSSNLAKDQESAVPINTGVDTSTIKKTKASEMFGDSDTSDKAADREIEPNNVTGNKSVVTASKKKIKSTTSIKKSRTSNMFSDSDSDSDSDKRFNKFSNSKPSNTNQGDLLNNLLSGQGKLLHSNRNAAQFPNQATLPVKIDMSNIAPGLPPIEQFKPPINGNNVTYRMWKLYDKAAPGKVLRCVVRSKVAGVTKEGVTVTPSVKLEHQPHFGAEKVSASRVTREWISTLVRPNSLLTRVRVTPDSKIAMIEEKTLPQLTQECRSVGTDPAAQLANVYNVVTELTQLPAGQYILHHSSKTGAFCDVLESKVGSKGGQVDLHSMYTTFQPGDTVPGKVAFSPIDTNILTPWHQVNGRVPGTFEPSGSKRSGGGRGGRGGFNRGGRNRGGKSRKGRNTPEKLK